MKDYVNAVNDPALDKSERLAALKAEAAESSPSFERSRAEINNHIHTIYSFSPYSPSMAALLARNAGLGAAGSVDHDSIAAAEEMTAACAVLGIGGCAGFEVRVSFRNGPDGKPGPFARRKINNPDSAGFVYMTVQGIPKQSLAPAAEFLAPVRAERLARSRAMAAAANDLLEDFGVSKIDFERDIYAKSKFAEGGEITERHLLAAMSGQFVKKFGKGPGLVDALKTKTGIHIPPKIAALLSDPGNPHHQYDLLGILKSGFLPRIFIQPDERECIPAEKVTAFAEAAGAIPAYAYLGDVGESPTGDKRPEKFEDDFIEELFAEISRRGYRALTYMPPRNTREQLKTLRRLAAEWGFMEISGVDINSSRQTFNCPEVLEDEFRHLLDTTWALIAHERLASTDSRYALFSAENPLVSMGLAERLACYAEFGKRLDLFRPEESAAALAAEMEKGRIP